jgi:hypothetical protein
MKPGSEQAFACTQHKFEHQGDPAYCEKTHIYQYHRDATVRQRAVIAIAKGLVTNADFANVYAADEIPGLAIQIADAVLKREAETR